MTPEELRSHTTVEALLMHYSPAAATAISTYIGEFLAYIHNFGTISCSFLKQDNQSLLFLVCPLYVVPPGVNKTEANCRDTETALLHVGVLFPSMFPSVLPFCSVMANRCSHKGVKWTTRQSSRVLAPNGSVQLCELSLLKGSTPPYSLLEILVALTEQFELEFPLIPVNLAGQSKTAAPGAVRGGGATTFSDTERNAVIRRASEAVLLHVLSKADKYLETREEALRHLQRLYQSDGALREARALLGKRKEELQQYAPAMWKVERLVSTCSHLPNSLEVHSTCIVPADDLHARALELLGEIHASDDLMDLLERSLKAGQLSCDEYVRLVSDLSRKQFEARFLFGHVAEAVNRTTATGSGSPLPSAPPRNRPNHGKVEVPSKIGNEEVLRREFPEVGPDVVKAVLNLADGNLADARVQIKAMLS
ncbi:hypothetical protein DQ04_12621010 [Trypanosoma grayi]|uniref:hypothetical protein n=1 Tax=Trypanosoma grayi TaxID=71804 RepID=UPI0004F41B19|nr:hypothetical protein DQ04_12621010 [Trypanosoma grayi]KEG06711.1 hypothetical protein DQ04_12621010 [Trypanosoma grayi]